MRCHIVNCGTTNILIVSNLTSSSMPDLQERLRANEINKMILREVPVELVRERYGEHFDKLVAKMGDKQFRVVDFNGASIFKRFSFSEMGEPITWEF